MPKLILSDVVSGYLSATAQNANNAAIVAAIENTVSRDGSSPNSILANFDANNYDLINVKVVKATDILIKGVSLSDNVTSANNSATSATASQISATASQVSATASQVSATASQVSATASQVSALDSKTLAEASRVAAAISASNALTSQNLASSSANTASNQAAIAASNATSAITTGTTVIANQSQVNALLGLGIGGSIVDAEGNLIMTYNDATVTSLAINSDGFLILVY